MKVKACVILILISFFLSNAYSQKVPSQKEMGEVYRQYFLARCIYFAFGEEKVFSQDISLAVYYAAGNEFDSTNHSRKLDSLAMKMLNSITPTQVADYEGRKPILMSCIEYYESKELKREITKILKIPRKSELFAPINE
ncbi:T6SS amidase immunity protein Tai4 family protein [Pedobacter foliorum]|uniref:T6SS amidase immunity protein Tai4 family protein n=1 Tax=Pedobacter foliorum TaxID=2739058 RepID=UPI001564E362|nr:T6SS amidase immunity protein Tai4 family protein [Pedobacter foliorum]NRF40706.1 hypothetical protein [Pedobacter foliorum]